MAINRYVYVSAVRLSDIIDYKFRLTYSQLERVSDASELEHPVVRALLQHECIDCPLDISIQADLPASSGLGSSSAFTVGLVNLLNALKGKTITRLDLGRKAIHAEQVLLKENVGVQDQLHAAFGGMNRFDFIDGRTRITPVQMTTECEDYLLSSLVLVYTGKTRFASKVLTEQMQSTKDRKIDRELSHLLALVSQSVDVLEGSDPEAMLRDFGRMMHEGWQTKRSLSSGISNPEIDALYEAALSAGAFGGKLCGAGGGGFLLMVVPPQARERFNSAMNTHSLIPVRMDREGSVILSQSAENRG
jgi:D-glycero-alpha-D-manno-heptose-7-phosphate kinase